MATVTDTTTDTNGNVIIDVSSSVDDAITLATAGTYSDKNIIFNITMSEELTNAVNTALAQAKASGEFDGADGMHILSGDFESAGADNNIFIDNFGISATDVKVGDMMLVKSVRKTTLIAVGDIVRIDSILSINGSTSIEATVTVLTNIIGPQGQKGETGAQVQSDWAQTDESQPDFIQNKPTIPDVQKQSDWNIYDEKDVSFIKNRPCYYLPAKGSISVTASTSVSIAKKIETINPDTFTVDDLINDKLEYQYSVDGVTYVCGVYEREEDVPDDCNFYLTKYANDTLKMYHVDGVSSNLFTPFTGVYGGYELRYRSNNEFISYAEVYLVNNTAPGRVHIMRQTSDDGGVVYYAQIDGTGIYLFVVGSSGTMEFNYDLSLLKKIDQAMLPDEAATKDDIVAANERINAKEDSSNKVIGGQDWSEADGDSLYPSMNKMTEYVRETTEISERNLRTYTREFGQYTVMQHIAWDGDTTGKASIYGSFIGNHYKVADFEGFPDRIAYTLSSIQSGYLSDGFEKKRLDNFREEYGFVKYGNWDNEAEALYVVGIIICDRSGTIPQEKIQTVDPLYRGPGISYESGVYLYRTSSSISTNYYSDVFGLIKSATKVSDLVNDAGYITESDMPIPTKISQFENDANYISRDEMARQLAAILPTFTSADEGKVLGIKNGKLAWVKVQIDQTDEPTGMDATVDGNVLVLGDGAYVDGNVLVLGDGVSVDGNTLVFSGETNEPDEAEANGSVLMFNDDSIVDSNTLVLNGDSSVDGLTLILEGN